MISNISTYNQYTHLLCHFTHWDIITHIYITTHTFDATKHIYNITVTVHTCDRAEYDMRLNVPVDVLNI